MEEMIRDWMVGIQGHRGLLSLGEMQDLIRSGALGKEDLVRRGVKPWKPASEYEELWTGQSPSATRPGDDEGAATIPEETRGASGPGETAEGPPPDNAPFPVSLREKYYSLTDAFRLCADAFSPLRLMVVAVLLLPAFPLAGLLFHFMDEAPIIAVRWGLLAFSGVLLLVALSLSVRAIAYETRCHLDLDQPPFFEVLGRAGRGFFDMTTPLLVTAIPALLILLFLSLMGLLRDQGPFAAMLMRWGYLAFLLLSLLAVLNVLFIFLLLIYLPAVMVVEGKGVQESIGVLLRMVKTQGGRLASHGAIIATVTFAMETFLICLGFLSLMLPELLFPVPRDPEILEAWTAMPWLSTIYVSLIFGILSVIPVSVAGTFSVISVLLLRQEERLIRDHFLHPHAPAAETAPPDETARESRVGGDSPPNDSV